MPHQETRFRVGTGIRPRSRARTCLARIGRLSGRRHAFGAAAPSAFALAARSGWHVNPDEMREAVRKGVFRIDDPKQLFRIRPVLLRLQSR